MNPGNKECIKDTNSLDANIRILESELEAAYKENEKLYRGIWEERRIKMIHVALYNAVGGVMNPDEEFIFADEVTAARLLHEAYIIIIDWPHVDPQFLAENVEGLKEFLIDYEKVLKKEREEKEDAIADATNLYDEFLDFCDQHNLDICDIQKECENF